MWAKKNECGQENLSVLSVSVSVDCGVWTVDYDSAVSGEPPLYYPTHSRHLFADLNLQSVMSVLIHWRG